MPEMHCPSGDIGRAGCPSPADCDIFDFIARDLGLTVIHPGGLAATAALAEELGIGPEMSVIDIGCGRGTAAVFLAERYGCRVTGIDISEELLAGARALAEKRGVADRVTFLAGDAAGIPFPEGRFDVAISQAVLVFFADKAPAIREARRVIRDGGRAGWLELSWKREMDDGMAQVIRREIRSHCMERAESFVGWRRVFAEAGITDLRVLELPFTMSFDAANMRVMLRDEGVANTLRIMGRYLLRKDVRDRMNAISRIFGNHKDFFGCGIYVVEKTGELAQPAIPAPGQDTGG